MEISLVIPIVLFVMVLIIHFAFYLYGRCILSQDVYLLAFRASVADEEDIGMDRASYLQGIAGAQFGRKYFGNRIPTLQVEASDSEIRVRGETEASHRAMSGSSLMPRGSWTHGAGARAEVVDPAARIRRIDRIGDIAKGALKDAFP
ncbi:MAG: hypothetical protein II800_06655 [Lachnospiraceae bacterium]|nr:hypothetical protein [Lachnospiraceae bacterium]